MYDLTGYITPFVTHDLADRVAILNEGRLSGSEPRTYRQSPATEFVAEFVHGIDLKRINTEALSPAARLTCNLKIVS